MSGPAVVVRRAMLKGPVPGYLVERDGRYLGCVLRERGADGRPGTGRRWAALPARWSGPGLGYRFGLRSRSEAVAALVEAAS